MLLEENAVLGKQSAPAARARAGECVVSHQKPFMILVWPVDVMICSRRATKMTCAGVYEGDHRNGKSHGSRVGNHTAEEAEDNTHRHHRGDGDDAVVAATHAPFFRLPTPFAADTLGLGQGRCGHNVR